MTDIEFLAAVEKAEEVKVKLKIAQGVEEALTVAINEARQKRIAVAKDFVDACYFAVSEGQQPPPEERDRSNYRGYSRKVTVLCHVTGKMTLVEAKYEDGLRGGRVYRQDIPYVTNVTPQTPAV